MDVIAGLNSTMLVAAGVGVVAVLAIGFGARALFGRQRDEVIERLQNATGGMGGLEASGLDRDRPDRGIARIAGLLRPFARLLKPTAGDELSRLNRSLQHAGYRAENVVEI